MQHMGCLDKADLQQCLAASMGCLDKADLQQCLAACLDLHWDLAPSNMHVEQKADLEDQDWDFVPSTMHVEQKADLEDEEWDWLDMLDMHWPDWSSPLAA